jgi:nucleoside-diphosphate-sugar epimerase
MGLHLVTGGAGFIGSNLVLALLRAGERVRVIDNLTTGFWENLSEAPAGARLECITGDIRDPELAARACRGADLVFHQAGLGSVPRSIEAPVETDAVNCGGTVMMLDAARRSAVKRLVFAASSSAYGDTPTLPKREDMPPCPLSPYAVSKLAAEQYLRVFSSVYGIETLGLRYFNVFGPRQRPDGPYAAAIPRFIWAALRGEPITVYGDGENTRDFCYIQNAVDANLQAANATRSWRGEIANVAGGRDVCLNDLIARIGQLLGRELSVVHVEPRPGDVRHSLADISRATVLFGYTPRVRWEAGLPETITFLRELAHARGLQCVA